MIPAVPVVNRYPRIVIADWCGVRYGRVSMRTLLKNRCWSIGKRDKLMQQSVSDPHLVSV